MPDITAFSTPVRLFTGGNHVPKAEKINNAVPEKLNGHRTVDFEESFVWPEGARPDIAHDTFDFQLPVIDLGPALKLERLRRELQEQQSAAKEGGERGRGSSGIEEEIKACEVATEGVVSAIQAACEEYGFFQIVNHGFPMEVTEQLYECCKYIFDQPLEVGTKYVLPRNDVTMHRPRPIYQSCVAN